MPRSAARRGPRELRPRLRFQVLRVAFEVVAEDPAVARQLLFLHQSAVQPEPPRARVSYEVSSGPRGHEIHRNGAREDVQFDAVGVLQSVYRLVQQDALRAWPEAAMLLRAVVGEWHGERFIVAGETLWDRSRLALRLLSLGASIECDDVAILHDGLVTGYPRPLRVWSDELPLPAAAPPLEELPAFRSTWSRSWSLDLGAAGVDWAVTTGPVDRVILLDTNYGGQTRVRVLPHRDAVRVLMSSGRTLRPFPEVMGAAARLVDGAQCEHLWLGSVGDVGDLWKVPLP